MESSCSEDPDVKGTETQIHCFFLVAYEGCSEDPDVKGTETKYDTDYHMEATGCSEDPDVKGTETFHDEHVWHSSVALQRGSRCKGN